MTGRVDIIITSPFELDCILIHKYYYYKLVAIYTHQFTLLTPLTTVCQALQTLYIQNTRVKFFQYHRYLLYSL